MIKRILIFIALTLVLVPAGALLAHRYTSFNLRLHVTDDLNCYAGRCGNSDTGNREAVACDSLPAGTRVWLVAGQSNSANYGETLSVPSRPVFNFNPFDGQCYRARDPLLGPDGDGGTVWVPLAEKVIAGGHAEAVLIAAVGVGGTPISRWQADGDLFSRLQLAFSGLREVHLPPTHFLWHQGEAELRRQTSYEAYRASFTSMVSTLRARGMNAPVMLAQASKCMRAPGALNSAVRSAQRDLASADPMIFAGPDTDQLLRPEDRYDGCHFSAAGMALHVEAWFDALAAADLL